MEVFKLNNVIHCSHKKNTVDLKMVLAVGFMCRFILAVKRTWLGF